MHILVYLKLSPEIINLLISEPEVTPPWTGLHMTILRANILEEHIPLIHKAFEKICIEYFTVKIIGIKTFEKDGACTHVLALSKPRALQELHMNICTALAPFDKRPFFFEKSFHEIGGRYYTPHISIGYKENPPRLIHTYTGMTIPYKAFHVMTKFCKESPWEHMRDYFLSSTSDI
ncbi:MAG: 2'-5' RNA ligase family protein [Candidatus Yonathbacteria bacterium]|nr:2'-5' RNA ligase family protein [Candidatus Yonathbacteria bacterium]NTW47616.1 2'-5' RNA ligase family protein [Candidatus Yonathbacteria bacterium]